MRKLTMILAVSLVANAVACHAQLVDVTWNGATGAQDWQNNANWVGGVFPNDTLKVADLSVNLGANLTVDIGATDVTVAGLSLGSTSGNVTTNITSTTLGTRLIFRNTDEDVVTDAEDSDFDNNTIVDGRDFLIWQRGSGMMGDNINQFGDANGDDTVNGLDLAIWQDQYGIGIGFQNPGNGFIESIGVAGATNTIAANIHAMNEAIEIGGTKNFTISGNVTYEGDGMTGVSNAGLRVMNPGLTVNLAGKLTMFNSDADEAVDFTLNANNENQGKLVVDGLIEGAGDLQIGAPSNSAVLPLGTVQLNNANTFTGGIRAGRGNLILNNNLALGTGSYRQNGPLNFGYNLISNSDTLVVGNEVTLAQWQTIKGNSSLTLGGEISQTNSRGFVNLLPAGKTLTLSGRVNIWELDELDSSLRRQLTFDGTGKTVISGTIHDYKDGVNGTFANYDMVKTGTGSLVINVADGTNNHSGQTTVRMGNLHYANNGSLNINTAAEAKILATGGAVGVDTHPPGQNLSSNGTFHDKIDPTSTGGLMLATTDSNVNLNFNAGTLANLANMSVAAPETSLSYTGTITPANNTYQLGGGTGTLTLPTAQLTGARSLIVKNGGTIRLLGDNNHTGSTTIISRYTSTFQEQAAADATNLAQSLFYSRLISPVLEIDDLANGGSASSIGSSTNAAANLVIQGSTLRYVGTGDTTDRLFTIGTGGATLDASGTGALAFTNTGSLAIPDATNKIGTLRSIVGGQRNVIYDLNDTSDVVVGLPVSDPNADAGLMFVCGFTGANCIPAGATVTGLSDDGKQIGISLQYPANIQKLNTSIVFGATARTMTLTGTNLQPNILSPVISNSAKGGVVNIVKNGTGIWLLESVNTTTGATTVDAGTLGGNGGVGGSLTVNSGGTFTPGGTGGSAIGDFSVGGSFTLNTGAILGVQLSGTTAGSYDVLNVTGAATISGALNISALAFSPSIGNAFTVLTAAGGITDSGLTLTGLSGFTKSIVGNSLIITKSAALSALAAVPEPSTLMLVGLAVVGCGLRRQAKSRISIN